MSIRSIARHEPIAGSFLRLFRLLADAVVVCHFGFIVFVLAGGFLVLRWPRVAWLHLPAAVWGALIEFEGWTCPLTPLENRFREIAGEAAYRGDFVARYLLPVIYPEALTPAFQRILGAAVIAVNAVAYALALTRNRRTARP
jgi:hypothetical protein